MNTSLRIGFRRVCAPITVPETKFGGDPVWIDGATWPLSKRLGTPMQFIAQVAVDPRQFPNAVARMAYVFITEPGDAADTWDPDSGENAVILQPGLPVSGAHAPLYTGPSLMTPPEAPVIGKPEWRRFEYAADLTLQTEPPFVPFYERLQNHSREEGERYWKAVGGHKIGGSRYSHEEDWAPYAESRLLLQFDGAYGSPFFVNFGDGGSAWAVANADVTAAKFCWVG